MHAVRTGSWDVDVNAARVSGKGDGRMYELFYSTGGHSGPFPTMQRAIERATRALEGMFYERHIDVRAYRADDVGGFGATMVRVERWEGR